MPLPLYLAMTAAEISLCKALPEPLAYMACHFSAYATGLSNLPAELPKGSMLILNDRVPVSCHDPVRITKQLHELCAELEVGSLLLDLQRPEVPETAQIVNEILGDLMCTVGVSELYAKGLDCPVFLSTPPPYHTLEEHISPWQGREIWLETALDGCVCTVTEADNRIVPCQSPEAPLTCQKLHCHYGIDQHNDRIDITMERTWEDLQELLKEAERLGITKAVGLYQQLRSGIILRDRP